MKGAEGLSQDDSIEPILKQGTWGIGFIGLAETLVALTGKHHGEDEESRELGIRIVEHLRAYCDRLAEEIEKLPADIKPKVILPDLKLCGDNAAMIGAAAYNLYKAGKFSDENLNADPSLELPYAESMLK